MNEEELDLSNINPGQPTQPPQNQAYVGDLNKTQIIFDLVKVPKEERDAAWKHQFLSNLPTASFRCGNPQVILGPDRFPYFQLFLPEPGVEFQSFVFDRMKDDFLLEKGIGVVINPTENAADWVFSYGDIVHYHLKKTLEYPESQNTNQDDMKIEANEQVMIGAPSEEMLPKASRKVLDQLLKMNNIPAPKILLMGRTKNGKAFQHLGFNITPKSFDDEKKYQGIMQALTWYMPKDYSIIGLNETQFEKGFQPIWREV